MIVSCNDKRYCNKYNRDTLKGRIFRKLNMVDWATKQYDFWKPVKDWYYNLAWRLYNRDMLNLSLKEMGAMPTCWFKYLKWPKR